MGRVNGGGVGVGGGPGLRVTSPESHNSSCFGTGEGRLDILEVGSREEGLMASETL